MEENLFTFIINYFFLLENLADGYNLSNILTIYLRSVIKLYSLARFELKESRLKETVDSESGYNLHIIYGRLR